ncbi:MAG: YdcF family protein, partial [Acidimicrobiales bacterium]
MRVDERTRRPHRRLILSAVAIVGALAVLSGALFVWPRSDTPTHADAVVVPGGEGERVPEAIRLVRRGLAPVLAVSAAHEGWGPCPTERLPVEVICFRPEPYTTQGEARWLADTARARGWRSVIVVVSTAQATRARLRVGRCYGGHVEV